MTDDKIFDFYQTSDIQKYSLPNSQLFDLESLQGRVLSSSYVPKPPDPVALNILQSVQELFDKFQKNGHIQFIYQTKLYLGQLS
jgi:hypothetical protein